MSLKYITVKEFSERAEVTPQAVYKRIKTDLKPYTKTVENKLMVSVDGLKKFKEETKPEPMTKTASNQATEHDTTSKELLKMVDSLNQSLNLKNIQLEEREREILSLKEAQETERAQQVEALNKTIEELTNNNEILEEQLKQKEVELAEVKGWLSQSLRIAEQTNYLSAQARLQEPEESTDIIPEDVQESAHRATQSDTEAPQVKPWYRRLFNRK